jgi:hypothetical protein
MPDFDTRGPQEQHVPNKPRFRTLLIGGGILLLVVAVLLEG